MGVSERRHFALKCHHFAQTRIHVPSALGEARKYLVNSQHVMADIACFSLGVRQGGKEYAFEMRVYLHK